MGLDWEIEWEDREIGLGDIMDDGDMERWNALTFINRTVPTSPISSAQSSAICSKDRESGKFSISSRMDECEGVGLDLGCSRHRTSRGKVGLLVMWKRKVSAEGAGDEERKNWSGVEDQWTGM
jgi:hypothetical protein